jgi:hypothetical protein
MTILTLILLAAQLAPTPPAQAKGWEKVFDVKAPGSWLASIWAGDNGKWAAGGKNVIVDRINSDVRVTPIQGRAAMSISQNSRGLFAVGSHGAIWNITKTEVRLEHQTRPTSQRRLRDPNLFFSIVEGEDDGEQGLIALGPSPRFSPAAGKWQEFADSKNASKRAQSMRYASSIPRPSSCGGVTWIAFPGTYRSGVLTCDDGRAFRVTDFAPTALPNLPKKCANIARSAFAASRLVITCGRGVLYEADGVGWRLIPSPFEAEAIALSPNCIWAASLKAVWRKCMPTTKASR